MSLRIRTDHEGVTRPQSTDRRKPSIWSFSEFGLLLTARMALLGVVCCAPWWFGGVELDTQVWLNSGLLVSLGCWTASSLISLSRDGSIPTRFPTLLVPIAGALLLGAVQLCPSFSAGNAISLDASRQEASKQESNRPSARLLLPSHPASHSLYPAQTRLEIARMGMAMIACYLGFVLFQNPRSQLWLWGSLAVNGAALAFFGIVQQLSWNGKLFWTVPLLLGGQPFASYVNRNNAAGYLNLCLAAALGLVIGSLRQTLPQLRVSDPAWFVSGHTKQRQPGPSRHGPGSRSIFDASFVNATLLAVVIAAGIVCSLSRGGVLAMLVAGGIALLLGVRTRGLVATGALFTGILGLVVGLVFWTGLEDRLIGRWNGSMGDTLESGVQTRLANWCDALQATHDFPLLGTGFGTYSFAYLPYQSWPAKFRFYNADNQFVESLVEGGWIGLSIVLLVIGLSLSAALILIRNDPRSAAGMVGLFVIASQSVSALFDFGPTMYANLTALAVLTGAISGRVTRLDREFLRPSFVRWLVLPELQPAGLVTAISLVLLGYGFLELREVSAAAECRTAWRELPKRLDVADALTDLPLEAAIQRLTTALAVRPDDADAQTALANLWVYRYRLQAFASLVELKLQGGPNPKWTLTDPILLFHRTNDWKRHHQSALLESVRNMAPVRDNLIPAYRHYLAARTACPLMPGLDLHLATLGVIIEAGETGIESDLRRAIALDPQNADLFDRCGLLAQSAGLQAFALECWSKCLILQPVRFQTIRSQLSGQRSLTADLQQLVPDSPQVLISIAMENLSSDEFVEERHKLALRAKRLLNLQSSTMTPQKQHLYLARIHRLLDEFDLSAAEYRQALSLEPLNIDWRMEFAELLKLQGHLRPALEQVKICATQFPRQTRLQLRVLELKNDLDRSEIEALMK